MTSQELQSTVLALMILACHIDMAESRMTLCPVDGVFAGVGSVGRQTSRLVESAPSLPDLL